ncbi:TraR/DksA C4-type zinc finger protein [Chitinophaga flava]|uniref:Transcriptional regulator, TraR/DksA family protein n=1 Tax=Chitinophaga flava TaxID=2259036 RepID=A0A365Y5G9_9BACT|nr:TraR/DksA C4-type zinc finger protein [Chitinophaga flava]RBL93135.1 transcriptional regulator, TraR/DksA family protein [Chitinophaga flava]
MATKKKVAGKSTQKVAQSVKAVAQKVTTAKKAQPAPAKKAAPAASKKAAAKKAVEKPAASKAVAQAAAKKTAATPKKAPVNSKTSSVPKVAVPAKTTVKKEPAVKQQVVTKSVAAEKEKPLISKSEEKELKTMAVKKADTKEQVAKEKESTKKAAEKPAVKAEKSAKSEKSEKPEKTEKPEKAEKAEKTEKTEKKGGKPAQVAYQPEFTKSVLDQPEPAAGPLYRYSDTDLQEFRELIQKKLEFAKKELVYLQGLITRRDEAGTDDTENKYMSMEDGSGSQEREQLNQMASRQIQFIDHLEKAMVRIENKTYGICRVTGKLIDKARLRAVPHATLSIEAKLAKSK